METTANVSLNFNKIVGRAKLVTLSPKECWKTIDSESCNPATFTQTILAPLVVLGILSLLIGSQVFGQSMGPLGTFFPPLLNLLIAQVVTGVVTILMFFVGAWVAQKLTAFFSGSTTYERAFSLVGHSAIPGLVGGLLSIVPFLTPLSIIFGVVGIYAFFQGSSVMTTVPERNRLSFVACYIVSMMILGLLAFGIGGGMVALLGLAPTPTIPS